MAVTRTACRSIARRLASSPSPWPVRLGANLGYRFYAHNLHRFYNCDWIIGRAVQRAKHGRPAWTAACA